jgi:hypothetical protein
MIAHSPSATAVSVKSWCRMEPSMANASSTGAAIPSSTNSCCGGPPQPPRSGRASRVAPPPIWNHSATWQRKPNSPSTLSPRWSYIHAPRARAALRWHPTRGGQTPRTPCSRHGRRPAPAAGGATRVRSKTTSSRPALPTATTGHTRSNHTWTGLCGWEVPRRPRGRRASRSRRLVAGAGQPSPAEPEHTVVALGR